MNDTFRRSAMAIGGVAARVAAILTVLVLLAPGLGVSAAAQTAKGPIVAHSLKMAGDATRVRLLLQFDAEPAIRWFLLRNPHRLVIDLPETEFRIRSGEGEPRGLVSGVQYGHLNSRSSRLIITADGPFLVESVDILENEASSGHRLVVDMTAGSEREFEAALADQIQATASVRTTPKTDRLAQASPDEERPFTVVVDPGHGGIDGGAEGTGGTQEKTITLAFALELRTALEEKEGIDVVLTRDKDKFLTLDERVRVARQHEAHLFISVHADSFRQSGVRGATIYTVSDRPSDAESAATAIRENLADQIAGISFNQERDDVADILVDLVRRETHRFSMRFARTLIGKLSAEIDLINNPHRFAGFKVLRAPDVPSVLLELGYLSNPTDEAQLRDPEWRARAIESVIAAIEAFAGNRNGAGG